MLKIKIERDVIIGIVTISLESDTNPEAVWNICNKYINRFFYKD